MADLEANLREFDIGQLVLFLNNSGKTGVLRIEGETKNGSIYLANGKVVHSECGDVSGLEALYEISIEDRGRALFEQGIEATQKTFEEDAGSLIQEFEKRRVEFKELKEKMPPLDAVLNKSSSVTNEGGVSLRRTDWQILALIDGKRTLKEAISAAKLGAYEAYKCIVWLKEQGLIFDPKEFERLFETELKNINIFLDEFARKGVGLERWKVSIGNWGATSEENQLLLESLDLDDEVIKLKEVKLKNLDRDHIKKLFASWFKFLEKEGVNVYGKILAKRKMNAVLKKMAEDN